MTATAARRQAASTSSASAAPASPRTRTSRGPGAPRCAAGTRERRSSWRRSTGVDVDVGGDPQPPAGFEAVVSTAHARARRGSTAGGVPRRARGAQPLDCRRRRARQDDDCGDDRVRPSRARRRPVLDHRRRRATARRERGSRGRAGSSSRATSRIARSRSCGPEIAVVTNVELDHHAAFASEEELARFFEDWLAGVPEVVRAGSSSPIEFELAVPGEHNRRNAAAALAALELAGVERADARPHSQRFSGRRPPLPARRRGRRHSSVRRLRPQPHGDRGNARDRARADRRGRLIAVYQPHVYERTRQLARELGDALGLADAAIVTDVIGGRDAPQPGVTGKLVLDNVPRGRPARLGARARRAAEARARLGASGRCRRDVRRGGAVADRASRRGGARGPVNLEQGTPLARLTTIGTGGPARASRPPSVARRARDHARVRGRRGASRVVIGLGSNVLAADDGVDALVLRLEGELAAVEVAGRSARRRRRSDERGLPPSRSRSRASAGFEFACAIPGTAGGGVRMNAGAYGLRLDRRPRPGARRRAPTAPTGCSARRARPDSYRHSELAAGTMSWPRSSTASTASARGRDPARTSPSSSRSGRRRSRRTSARSAACSRTRRATSERAHARGVRAQGPSHRRGDDLAEARELHRERRRRRPAPTVSRSWSRRGGGRASSSASSSSTKSFFSAGSSCRSSCRTPT